MGIKKFGRCTRAVDVSYNLNAVIGNTISTGTTDNLQQPNNLSNTVTLV